MQVTSIACRKCRYRGKNVVNSGRPKKISYTLEHGYNKTRIDPRVLPSLTTKRKYAAPHNLSECVRRGVRGGR